MAQQPGLRPGQAHRAEAQFELCGTFGSLRRRRQTSLPATMHSTSAAPLYRDDDPRTDPMTSQFAPTCRHLCKSRSVAIQITWIPDSGIPLARPESIRRTRCVHALALARGRRDVEIVIASVSEAIQLCRAKKELIASSLALLAMTSRYDFAISPRVFLAG